jgi:hypothetical protein
MTSLMIINLFTKKFKLKHTLIADLIDVICQLPQDSLLKQILKIKEILFSMNNKIQ